jgi:transposase
MRPSTFAKGNKRTVRRLIQARKQAHADKAPRVALRIQAILLSLGKKGPSDVARLLHVPRSCVHEWINAWNEYRMLGLLEGHRSGRRPKLTEEDKQRLFDIVDSGPVAYGLETGVWTSPIIAEVINEEFDVSYHPGHVRRLLRNIGLSVQRPTTKLAAADPKKQNKWIRYTQPNLKKKPEKKAR